MIASNTYAAIAGREALEIEWDDGPHAGYDSEQYHKEMSATAAKPGKVIRSQGDVDAALANAARTFSAEYYQPHMAHISMEPPVALAHVHDGQAEIWACVQSPYGTRQDVAEKLGMPIENVTVNVTLLGGGFGRKSKCDYVLEAAILSQQIGAPVRVQWTREDDIQHCFYHTTSVERIEAAIDGDGKVTGWLHRSVAPSILSTFAADSGHQFPIEYGMGFVDMPFDIPNIRAENGKAMAHTRIGWFRSVSNVPRAFAVQSFAAELANELGRDQKDFLLELIGEPRVIAPESSGFPADYLELRRALCRVSDRHRAPAGRDRARRKGGRLGQAAAGGRGAWHRGPSQLRLVHRLGGAREGGRGRQCQRAGGAHRGRLRLRREPGADPLTDRGGRGDGHDAGHVQRDHVRERPRAAEQLP